MSYFEQIDTITALYIAFGLFISILFIYVLFCIISIKNQLKSLVDLEFKKYKENKNESSSSIGNQFGSDRSQ